VYGYGFSSKSVRAARFGNSTVAFKIVNAGLIEVTSPPGRGGETVDLLTPAGWTKPVPGAEFTFTA
jgi:hypothetical protein